MIVWTLTVSMSAVGPVCLAQQLTDSSKGKIRQRRINPCYLHTLSPVIRKLHKNLFCDW